MRKLIALLLAGVALAACDAPAPTTTQPTNLQPASPVSGMQYIRAPLYSTGGGTPVVNVAIDGICCGKFIVDSGASDVSVAPAVFAALYRSGRVTKADLIDVQKYRTAGSGVVEGLRFRMPPLTVGGYTVYNVIGSVTPGSDMMLLGQSFLTKFKSWSIDNATGTLVLGI